jgi:hypothetical protein
VHWPSAQCKEILTLSSSSPKCFKVSLIDNYSPPSWSRWRVFWYFRP